MDNPVIIFGANSVGRAALDIFTSNGVVAYGFLEENKQLHGSEINTTPILGHPEDDGFLKLIGRKTEAFVAVDELKYRKFLVDMLNDRRKVQPINAIHPDAILAPDAQIGHGNFINARVVLGSGASIGQHCLIHAGVLIEPLAQLGDFVQVGAGSVINSEVSIAEGVFIGSGVTIVSGVTIGKNARIGAGSVVISSVGANETVFGNPAAPVK